LLKRFNNSNSNSTLPNDFLAKRTTVFGHYSHSERIGCDESFPRDFSLSAGERRIMNHFVDKAFVDKAFSRQFKINSLFIHDTAHFAVGGD